MKDAEPEPRREPFSAVVVGTGRQWFGCEIVADDPVEIAPGQVFRVTRRVGSGFRVLLLQRRYSALHTTDDVGAEIVVTDPNRLRIDRHFNLVPFPQDIDGAQDAQSLQGGEAIVLTPLVPIAGSEDVPRKEWDGVSDVVPGGRSR